MTGVKALTDVMLEVDAGVDIVNNGRLGCKRLDFGYANAEEEGRELWPSLVEKPGYIPPASKTNPGGLRLDCCHRCHGQVKKKSGCVNKYKQFW